MDPKHFQLSLEGEHVELLVVNDEDVTRNWTVSNLVFVIFIIVEFKID